MCGHKCSTAHASDGVTRNQVYNCLYFLCAPQLHNYIITYVINNETITIATELEFISKYEDIWTRYEF